MASFNLPMQLNKLYELDRLQKNAKIQSSYMDSLCTKNELNKIVEIE